VQRVVSFFYCRLVIYCCIWVPWSAKFEGTRTLGTGYGWLWAGPVARVWAAQSDPDLPIIGLRLLAATAIWGAAMLLATIVFPRQRN